MLQHAGGSTPSAQKLATRVPQCQHFIEGLTEEKLVINWSYNMKRFYLFLKELFVMYVRRNMGGKKRIAWGLITYHIPTAPGINNSSTAIFAYLGPIYILTRVPIRLREVNFTVYDENYVPNIQQLAR